MRMQLDGLLKMYHKFHHSTMHICLKHIMYLKTWIIWCLRVPKLVQKIAAHPCEANLMNFYTMYFLVQWYQKLYQRSMYIYEENIEHENVVHKDVQNFVTNFVMICKKVPKIVPCI